MASVNTTFCPLCRLPLSQAEIEAAPEGEYPSHYSCRAAMQERREELDLEEQEREYRGKEQDRPQDECSP